MESIKFEDGVHTISNNEYHSSSGVSRSALCKLKRSPLHYWHEYLNPNFIKPLPTANMYMGSLVHTLVLEPNLFDDEYIIEPQLEPLPQALKLKDVGREAFDQNKIERESLSVANELVMDEFNIKAEGKIVLSLDTFKQAESMRASVMNNDIAKSLLDGAKVEQSIYFSHHETGLQAKCRPDAWLGSIVSDLKTCADASFRAFQSEAMRYSYFLQAGMIKCALQSIGIDMESFVFLCVEKTEPFITANYILDEEAIDYGVDQFNALMIKLKECIDSDRWPAYPTQTLTMPAWAKYDEVL